MLLDLSTHHQSFATENNVQLNEIHNIANKWRKQEKPEDYNPRNEKAQNEAVCSPGFCLRGCRLKIIKVEHKKGMVVQSSKEA